MNVTIDIFSALICIILLSYLLFENSRRNKLRGRFLWLCIFSFGMTVGDIPNWICEGVTRSWYPVLLWSSTVLYWVCTSLTLLSFTAYLIEYLSERVSVHKRFWNITVALGILNLAGAVLSIRNGMFFTITVENIYRRGDWFWLSQFTSFSIYAVNICIFVAYHKKLSLKDFRILSSCIILPLAAGLIQAFNYGTALLNAGVSLVLLLIFINIQSDLELRLERQEKVLAEQRMDIMLSQIQPHFLYNSLTAIHQLCDNNPQQAQYAIKNFCMFLRTNINFFKSKAPIPFEQELTYVGNYLALEQQRFQQRLNIIYDIKCNNFFIPPLTLQPIVENAVRHGVLKRENGGTIIIRTRESEKEYIITVEDDGVGIADITDDRAHIGIENVRGRLKALCNGTLKLQSKLNVGTLATITLPKEAIE